MPRLKAADRVEMIGLMNDPDPIPVGEQGTVITVLNEGRPHEQAVVSWDSGRSLMLLPQDPFRVL